MEFLKVCIIFLVFMIWITNCEKSLKKPKQFENRMDLAAAVGGVKNSSVGPSPSIEKLGQYAGFYTLHDSARMFYFFFESRKNNINDPMVIWLSGGPGCSSSVALFYENGPFKISNNLPYSLSWNEFGWDQVSNIIYVDQPMGTGFSYASNHSYIPKDEEGVSEDLYRFLQAFFKDHPEFSKNDFYITGESYAGHYIPALASRINKGNKKTEGLHINLKGFAIGNGLTNPEIQYGAYADYAQSMNLISKSVHERADKDYIECQISIRKCNIYGGDSCASAYLSCEEIFDLIMSQVPDINYYDLRKKCIERPNCYDFSKMEKFLNQENVQKALRVHTKFKSCNDTVYNSMSRDEMRNLEVGIPELLEDGINVLIYAGEYDLICNWLGNSRWVENMTWSGNKNYVLAKTLPFFVQNKEAGLVKSYGPLTFLKIYDAGHLVPMDQPKVSLEMLENWIHGKLG